MEISLNNIGMRNGTLESGVGNVGSAKVDEARTSRPVSDFTVSTRANDLDTAEPVKDISDSAIVRDDALGRFVNSVFNLPPPPMPVWPTNT